MVIISAVTLNTQTALAASWSTKIEEWLNGNAATWAIVCEGSLRLDQTTRLSGDPWLVKGHDQLLAECDNNLLIINKDQFLHKDFSTGQTPLLSYRCNKYNPQQN
jgi:hypothetical protein